MGSERATHDAVLITDELVANAVRHGSCETVTTPGTRPIGIARTGHTTQQLLRRP